jgi:hypothetical protein
MVGSDPAPVTIVQPFLGPVQGQFVLKMTQTRPDDWGQTRPRIWELRPPYLFIFLPPCSADRSGVASGPKLRLLLVREAVFGFYWVLDPPDTCVY